MKFTGFEYPTAFFMDGFTTPSGMPQVSLRVNGNQAELSCQAEPLAKFYFGKNMQDILTRNDSKDDVAFGIFGLTLEELACFEPSAEMLKAQAEANSFIVGYQPAKDGGKSVTFIVFKGGFGWVKVQPPKGSNYYYLSTPSVVSKLSTSRNQAVTVCEGCVTAKDLKPRALCISDDQKAGLLMVAQPIVFELLEGSVDKLQKTTLALLRPKVDQKKTTQTSQEWDVLGYFRGKDSVATLLNDRSAHSSDSEKTCKN
jgi:hypothetical protein